MDPRHDDPRQSERGNARDPERYESERGAEHDESERGAEHYESERGSQESEYQQGTTGLLESSSVSKIESQWSEIKTRFVDDPKGALDEAFGLLERTFEELSSRMRGDYDKIREGTRGSDVTTEDLRRRLQDCRSMIDRMVPRSLH